MSPALLTPGDLNDLGLAHGGKEGFDPLPAPFGPINELKRSSATLILEEVSGTNQPVVGFVVPLNLTRAAYYLAEAWWRAFGFGCAMARPTLGC